MPLFRRKEIPIEESDRGGEGVPVYVQDQTTPLLAVPFLQERTTATLSVDTVVNEYTVHLESGHGALAGEVIELANADGFMQAVIITPNATNVVVDTAINDTYLVGETTITISKVDMNVDGSVTPQVFSVLPGPNQAGDLVRVIFEMRGTNDMTFSTFGPIPKLTRGCLLRVNNGDGTYRNILNFKDCGDWIEHSYDHTFFPNNGGGIRAFTSRLTWGGASKHGVVVRVEGTRGESLELVVQDDLSVAALTRFHMIAQGHELQE